MGRIAALSIVLLAAAPAAAAPWPRPPYPFASVEPARGDTLAERFAPPPGFERVAVAPLSFGAWSRGLPLEPGRGVVHLHDGRAKARQDVHAAVLAVDVGRSDLQQCADAFIRLHAEHRRAAGRDEALAFRFTSGDLSRYEDWARGVRPEVQGWRVRWERRAAPDASYPGFRRWLDLVFTYAGSASLARDLATVAVAEVEPGDAFVQGGFPGHVVIVLDVAEDRRGRRAFLLAQSFMPAQEIHVLRGPRGPGPGGEWYGEDFGAALVTPEWTFRRDELRRLAGAAPTSRAPSRSSGMK